MQTFTGTEYLQIDIANQFGLDRLEWDKRIWWVKDNIGDLKDLDSTAKHPILFRKAYRALKEVIAGRSTNHLMGLDATASGIQIMAAMSGCHRAAKAVNLIDTGQREDLYDDVALNMTKLVDIPVDRERMKKPVMTFFYGSQAVPKQVFGDGQALVCFFNSMLETLPGPYKLMQLFQRFWDGNATEYTWVLPDGHVAKIPVTSTEEKGMEIDEENHLRFHYRAQVIKPQSQGKALAANIVHSVDGWVCREMVKRAAAQGFWLAPIHDCFYASPNNMNQVRLNYRDIMVELSQMNLVAQILSSIRKQSLTYRKLSTDLHIKISSSEYALS